MYDTLVTGVSNILLNFLLVPQYGLVGAALATTLAYTLSNILGLVQLYRISGIQPFTVESCILPGLAIGLFATSYEFVGGVNGKLKWFFLWAGISSIIYGAIALYIVYGEDEQDILKAIIDRFGR
jgi:O-antigen/teichoic acid export membrane protein